ncbi:MAG TPA: acireductone dioxygenase [Azospirillum sp.]|nr:acireductone dioxygenase [Azospirillum sp.]
MTSLAIHWDADPATADVQTSDPLVVSAHLAHAGILFERWESAAELPADADEAAVQAVYGEAIERLKRHRAFQSFDVVRVTPETSGLDALRAKFMAEHTHTEDEARFFVAGSGSFFLHIGVKVYRVRCGRGDLISIPAGTRHWFDMGPRPEFTAIRFFTRPDGWVAAYTGDVIAERFSAPVA